MASSERTLNVAVFHNLPSGGAKRALYEMAKRLAARHALDLYTIDSSSESYLDMRHIARRSFSADLRFTLKAGRWFSCLNPLLKFVELWLLMRASRKIADQINKGGYDVVLVNPCRMTQTPVILRYLDGPTIYLCQEPARQFYEASFRQVKGLKAALKRLAYAPVLSVIRRLERGSLAGAGVVLVNSYYSRETLYRIYGRNAGVLYLGVDGEEFRPLERVAKEQMILAVGRIAAHKAYDFLLRSVALLDRKARVVLVCDAADPAERRRLEEIARSLGIGLAIMEGVSDEKLVELYNRASVLAHPAILEPFGLAPLEAMACGTPVVGIREAGLRESVQDGKTGILTERDERSFARALARLLKDEASRRLIGETARRYVQEKWSWDRSVAQLEEIMMKLTRGGAQEPSAAGTQTPKAGCG